MSSVHVRDKGSALKEKKGKEEQKKQNAPAWEKGAAAAAK